MGPESVARWSFGWLFACSLVVAGMSGCGKPPYPLGDVGTGDASLSEDVADAQESEDSDSTGDPDTRLVPRDTGIDEEDTGEECTEEDEPDPEYRDSNCDGIDGDREGSVFVATFGDDENPGTLPEPKRTIQAGIQAAKMDPERSWVLVEAALFEETVNLAEGVHLAGGYNFQWERGKAGATEIRSGNPTLRGEGIAERTVVTGFKISPPKELQSRKTVVTAYLKNSGAVELVEVEIVGGRAGNGATGTTGNEGANGGKGGNGQNGKEDDGKFYCDEDGQPNAGSGGGASCSGNNGGRGGLPRKGDRSGKSGEPGSRGAQGGAGGKKGSSGKKGADGMDGGMGMPGKGAKPGGQMMGLEWKGDSGERGGKGQSGSGGGGGGGGGGGDSGSVGAECDSYGGAGGGGGAGGCGGQGGAGGEAGGASIALYLENSDIVLKSCKIDGGTGGAGGAGGAGGLGGDGGAGGKGGSGEDTSGSGGEGGDGGEGGQGGVGGGGAGGPSFGIYTTTALSKEPVETEIIKGEGGTGGAGPTPEATGADGVAEKIRVKGQ